MSDQRDQLKALVAERLAEVLDELTAQDGAAAAVVERLLSSSAERIKRLRAKLKSLSRRMKFVDYRAAAGHARVGTIPSISESPKPWSDLSSSPSLELQS